jgi:segregation and condensation protein A
VKAAKIRIEDIFISKITEQYLSYMDQLRNIDLERASEFIEVAAILIEIKSKALLPGKEDDAEDNSAKRELIQRIEEYKLFKEACAKLKEHEAVGAFYKEPDASVGETRIILKDMNMDGLKRALQKLFLKIEQKALAAPERRITLDRFTVAEKITHIKDALLFRDSVSFFELFDADYSKSEIITTFQALLELLKMQFIKAEQLEIFGDIILKKVGA